MDENMNVSEKKADELAKVLREYQAKIRYKSDGYDIWWHSLAAVVMHVIFFIGFMFTLGKFRSSFNDFSTCFGKYFYLSDDLKPLDLTELTTYMLLRHELIHLMQEEDEGVFWFRLKYLILPLPFVWSYRGFDYELEAYTQQIICWVENNGEVPDSSMDRYVSHFSSPAYLFMYPFKSKVREHLKEKERQVKDGEITGLWPYQSYLLDER